MPLEVYKGRGRRARRITVTRPGSFLFRLYTNWLRSGLSVGR